MRSRRLVAALVTLVVVGGLFYMAAPYARAASFIVRAAKLGGRMESFARDRAYTVTKFSHFGNSRASIGLSHAAQFA